MSRMVRLGWALLRWRDSGHRLLARLPAPSISLSRGCTAALQRCPCRPQQSEFVCSWFCCGSIFGVVPYVATQDQIDDVLCDISRVICDAFEISGDQDQIQSQLD